MQWNIASFFHSLTLFLILYWSIADCHCCSVAKSCPTHLASMDYSTPRLVCFPAHHHLPEFAQTHVHWVSDAIQPTHPLSAPSPLALNLSQNQGLSNELGHHIRWPKYWSFKLQHHSFQWILTIDFFQDWLVWFPCYPRDFQESSPASILRCSAFFMVQLSHPYMTTGKTTVLTIWTFVSKVMSLLFNMLSRFVIAFLLRSKCLLIPWLQSPSAVILEPQKI